MSSCRWVGSLIAIGVLLVGSVFWHLLVLGPTAPWPHRLIDSAVIGSSGIGFLYGGYWYATRPFTVDRYPTIVGWVVGACLLFAGLGVVALYVGSEQISPIEFVEVLHLTTSAGLLSGLLVGTLHMEALRNAEAASRAEAQAEALVDERERLEQLTDLLRHYILNSVTVIRGYADHLQADVPEERAAALDTIASRAQMIATLVEHIRSIQGIDADPVPTRLDPVVASATEAVTAVEDVTVTMPADALVVSASSRRLEEAVSLLCDVLTSATDGESTLQIACSQTDGTVTLSIAATPATPPAWVEYALAEPVGTEAGLQVYLAQRLLDTFGEVTLPDTPRDSVQFDLLLSAAPVDG